MENTSHNLWFTEEDDAGKIIGIGATFSSNGELLNEEQLASLSGSIIKTHAGTLAKKFTVEDFGDIATIDQVVSFLDGELLNL